MSNRSITGYGPDYEQRIGEGRAKALLGKAALPRMGHEVVVRGHRHVDPYSVGASSELTLQNISGVLVLASSTHSKDQWLEAFGVDPN